MYTIKIQIIILLLNYYFVIREKNVIITFRKILWFFLISPLLNYEF